MDALIGFFFLVSFCLSGVTSTALDEYVWKADNHYSWQDTGTVYEGGKLLLIRI